jgi:uncharacterized protein (DUF433 family)
MASSALISQAEAAALSGASPTTVKKAVDQRIIPTRKLRARSYIEADDVAVLAILSQLGGVRLGLSSKRRLRGWLRSAGASAELELTPALVVRRTTAVEDARRRAERYARLREKWIACDPEIKGGEPIVNGSRVSVHTLAARIESGESLAVLEEDFPHIPAEAREIAVQYAKANPRRGRPRRSSSTR